MLSFFFGFFFGVFFLRASPTYREGRKKEEKKREGQSEAPRPFLTPLDFFSLFGLGVRGSFSLFLSLSSLWGSVWIVLCSGSSSLLFYRLCCRVVAPLFTFFCSFTTTAPDFLAGEQQKAADASLPKIRVEKWPPRPRIRVLPPGHRRSRVARRRPHSNRRRLLSWARRRILVLEPLRRRCSKLLLRQPLLPLLPPPHPPPLSQQQRQ